jgi:hypothetical protein
VNEIIEINNWQHLHNIMINNKEHLNDVYKDTLSGLGKIAWKLLEDFRDNFPGEIGEMLDSIKGSNDNNQEGENDS